MFPETEALSVLHALFLKYLDTFSWIACAVLQTTRHSVVELHVKVKVKSSMARSLPVENLLPQNVGSIVNYLQ